MSLDLPAGALARQLQQIGQMLERFHASLPGRPVFHRRTTAEVRRQFAEPLPRAATPIPDLLRRVEDEVLAATTLTASGRFFGYVVSGGAQAGALADLLAAGYGICGGKWLVSAAHAELERRAVAWIAELIGLPADCEGLLTSGGSEANLTALLLARDAAFPGVRAGGLGARRPVVYTSTEGHSSVQKAVEAIGIGSRRLRRIAVDEAQRMRPPALAAAIERDRARGLDPCCVVATAGTTNTGAIDPLREVAAVCRRQRLWLHVDGAYGAPAAGLPTTTALFDGLSCADSITVDPHKWLYVPFDVGCLLVRHRGALRRSFRLVPPYLASDDDGEAGLDWHEHGLQLSRSSRGLKVWMTLLAYGADRIRDAIAGNLALAQRLAAEIAAAPDFELVAPAPLSAVCFRYLATPPAADAAFNDRLQRGLAARARWEGELFLAATTHRGEAALRVCIVNHRTTREDVDRILPTLRRLARDGSVGAMAGARDATWEAREQP